MIPRKCPRKTLFQHTIGGGRGISTIPNHEEHFFSRALMIERHILTGPSNLGKQRGQVAFPHSGLAGLKTLFHIVNSFFHMHTEKLGPIVTKRPIFTLAFCLLDKRSIYEHKMAWTKWSLLTEIFWKRRFLEVWITVCPSRFSDLPTALNEQGHDIEKREALALGQYLCCRSLCR